MAGSLSGKVALVTGSGSGLGRGIAEELARAGADIAVAEIDAATAETAASELSALGVRARAYPTDVSKSAQVDATFAAAVRDLGRLDVVVNNAGISRVGPQTHEVTDEDWHDSIAVMQTGVFFGIRAAGRTMIEQGSGGSIINISSIRGFSPNPGRMTYCAPKAAVIMMTHIAAGEWAGHGIRVNAIAPGWFPSDMSRFVLDLSGDLLLEDIPLRRFGGPDDLKGAAVFLASAASAYVTGHVLVVDGGQSA
jgi:NAD(P)-dependent dehydrogenase (short-subunit alcohol dehydrogenase family)